jgi:threonine dehydratase
MPTLATPSPRSSTAAPGTVTGPRPTTLIESPRLSERLGADVVIASETFQWTGSFKFRAAYNVARSVPNPAIITASSGNFGQAIAFACQLLGKRCTVVMPANSVRVKVDAVRSYGATADLIDTAAVRREVRVAQLVAQTPEAYMASAYDDPLVIQGNASLGDELAQHDFDAILVPVGGGGLASGVITGLRRSGADTPVWGAEPEMGNDFVRSLREGKVFTWDAEPQTVADGARTRSVGKHNWAVLQDGAAGALDVPEAQILEGVRVLFGLANVKAEPTGALTVGALLAHPDRFRDQRVCCIVSGGNADPASYARIIST